MDKRIKKYSLTSRWQQVEAENRYLRLWSDFLIAGTLLTHRPALTKKLAVIDVGSNTVRLEIYDNTTKPPTLIHEDGADCGLARDMVPDDPHPRLNNNGMKRALQTLEDFRKTIHDRGIDTIVAVGTEALRAVQYTEAGAKFIVEAEETLGIPINIISGKEESSLTRKAVLYAHPRAEGYIIGTGGASTEAIKVSCDDNGFKHYFSRMLRVGALTLFKKSKHKTARATQIMLEHLENIRWLPIRSNSRPPKDQILYLVGGTFRAVGRLILSRMHAADVNSPFQDGGPSWVRSDNLTQAIDFISSMKTTDVRTYAELSIINHRRWHEFTNLDGNRLDLRNLTVKDLRRWRSSDEYQDWKQSAEYREWRNSDDYKKWERRLYARARLVPLAAKIVAMTTKRMRPHSINFTKHGIRTAIANLEA